MLTFTLILPSYYPHLTRDADPHQGRYADPHQGRIADPLRTLIKVAMRIRIADPLRILILLGNVNNYPHFQPSYYPHLTRKPAMRVLCGSSEGKKFPLG